jgi:DNA-binding transcriptional regulator YiaG
MPCCITRVETGSVYGWYGAGFSVSLPAMTQSVDLLIEARQAAKSGEAVELREAADLSQGEVARAARVSAASLSRWEAGSRKPSGEAAIRYARTLRRLRARQDENGDTNGGGNGAAA